MFKFSRFYFVSILVLSASISVAATNPISVESRDIDTESPQYRVGAVTNSEEELQFQPPIEEGEPLSNSSGEAHYQMQLLQQEVEQLRGMVEELKYGLKQMRATEDARYLELDSRFQNFQQADKPAEAADNDEASDESFAGAEQDEKTLYESAIKLIRGRQYDMAIAQLQNLISSYPDGMLAPNAYYWLGEVYAAKPQPDYENARKALVQVITFFPEHRKVSDAAFKLGKVYHLMGDCRRATDLLKQVIIDHQGKSVSKLAEAYLRDKITNCP
ncbi:MAG: tol-pal system protein YbgF [Candidatus Azotimanducaceae bacterium]|jgi:tol-pal system protein YbgF